MSKLDEMGDNYKEEYRQKKKEREFLRNNLESLNSELHYMQNIIWLMIEDGCDLVEAKLKYDDNSKLDRSMDDYVKMPTPIGPMATSQLIQPKPNLIQRIFRGGSNVKRM